MNYELKMLDTVSPYKKSKHGVIKTIYYKQRERCYLKGWSQPEYTFEEVEDWCLKQPLFHLLYANWINSKYARWLKPSIDRIDCLIGYRFGNIQLMTAGENRLKQRFERIILVGKPIAQYTLDNQLICIYPSIKEAAIKTKCSAGHISGVANKLEGRTQTGGFKWFFVGVTL